ncbi:UNVERIFIED_CONTAM: hypothetical protein K2H54_046873 [Gekko kuhli]
MPYSGANTGAIISRQLEEWVGSDLIMGFMVRDGSTNMRVATKAVGLRHTPCAAHLLHLLVRRALGQVSENPQHVAKHCTYRHLLLKCCDISTCWNFTCVMLGCLVEQKRALIVLISESRVIQEDSQLTDE